MEKRKRIFENVKASVAKNFRRATLNFLFIILFVNLFQRVFGLENSIVGVIFTILMSASMVRDMTAAPVRHLLSQTAVLFLMAASACFVASASPLAALPVNFLMTFLILYAFTYEYVSHLYFPYILSYLFLVFISPIGPELLPKRLAAVSAGAACVILYQLINGRSRVVETARDVLCSMIDQAGEGVSRLLEGRKIHRDPEGPRARLCRLSQIIYERRKKVLRVSDASFAMLDSGRGLENLILLLEEMSGPITPERAALLGQVGAYLPALRAYMTQETAELPPLFRKDFGPEDSAEAQGFYLCLLYIRRHMLSMTLPEKQKRYRKTMQSFSFRLKAALRLSPVRLVYALRVAGLLALCTLLVQRLGLPHGKWLLFTVASVSLPYADDVGVKAKKRMLATLVGGLSGALLFSLIPSAAGRSLVMMLSGYLSFYFTDYSATFACSTVGALGGAVFLTAFGWREVGWLSLARLGYILLGIAIAMLANIAFFPYRRATATRQLLKKYCSTTELLSRICQDREADPQLYYSLVIHSHLQENKIRQNARELNWTEVSGLLEKCRQAVRAAHRARPEPELSPEME